MATNAWMDVQIVQKRLEADDIVSLLLRAVDGDRLPLFEAGAHIDLEIAPDLIRQYSLCNRPDDDRTYEIAVLREPASRGGSAAIHDRLQVGQTVRISAPRNHFPLDHATTHSLLFAGGIGITPILCMAERLHGAGASYEMHYCARSAAKMAYRDAIAASPVAARSVLHLDDGPAGQQIDLARILADPAAGAHVYVCGPAGFINAVLECARAQGWAEEQLHREFFAAPTDRPAPEGADESFTVTLASTGLSVEIPAGRTIVDILGEQGVFIPTSCSEGICGTCVVHVLEGVPDHRDYLLSDEEHARGDRLTTCCSRSKTPRLVLDL